MTAGTRSTGPTSRKHVVSAEMRGSFPYGLQLFLCLLSEVIPRLHQVQYLLQWSDGPCGFIRLPEITRLLKQRAGLCVHTVQKRGVFIAGFARVRVDFHRPCIGLSGIG